MAQIREIKKRMVAVRTIQRITKTMQMIATAKFNASMLRSRASRPYTDALRRLVEEVSAAAGDASHPLMESPKTPSGTITVIVITSDRGLCGAYNGHVLRKAEKLCRGFLAENKKLRILIAGKKGVAFFKFARIPSYRAFTFGDKPTFEETSALAQESMDEFVGGVTDAVYVVYMRFVNAAKQTPEAMQLLPITKVDEASSAKPTANGAGGAEAAVSPMEFSPSAEQILTDLLPRAVKIQMFQAFLDAAVSEQATRRVAMKAATDNASGLSRLLKRNFNRARQGKITTELTEIISGAAALT